jgi:hypothetical protein
MVPPSEKAPPEELVTPPPSIVKREMLNCAHAAFAAQSKNALASKQPKNWAMERMGPSSFMLSVIRRQP